jgi:uncharacterized protein (TIGR02246 family)
MNDEQAIRDLIATWHRATAAGDLPAILALMAEDVVFLTPGQPPMRGRDAFAATLRQVLKAARVDSTGEVQELRVSHGVAYAWTHLSVTVTPRSGGAAMHRSGDALTIFRKQPAGNWVAIRDANMLAAEP